MSAVGFLLRYTKAPTAWQFQSEHISRAYPKGFTTF
ncbi:MAG: hypothetical protein ACI8PT_004870, partial [Gammaproteobacteria bacterium]